MFKNFLLNSSYFGIYLYQANTVRIYNNTIKFNGAGIEIDYANMISILYNTISYNKVGIYLGDGIYNLSLMYNIISYSSYFGLLIHYYPTVFISKNNEFISSPQFYDYEKVNTTLIKVVSPTINGNKGVVEFPRIAYYVLALAITVTVFIVVKKRR